METMTAIKTRQSTRSYQEEQIREEQLQNLLLAACAAPVGMAKFDSMHITVVQASGLLQRINENMMELLGEELDFVPTAGAPTLILISSNDEVLADANTGCIMENMMLAATDMGLGSLYLWSVVRAINKNRDLLAELDLPQGFTLISGMGVGYAKELLREREIQLNKIGTDFIR